jgi:ATP-binding cassette subfamily C (CFTR/MRP) protein 1
MDMSDALDLFGFGTGNGRYRQVDMGYDGLPGLPLNHPAVEEDLGRMFDTTARRFDATPAAAAAGSESRAVGVLSRGALLRYFANFGGWLFLPMLIVSLVAYPALSVLSNWWLSVWVGGEESQTQQGRHGSMFYVDVYLFIGIALCLSILARNLMFVRGVLQAAQQQHYDMLTRLVRLPCSFFDTVPGGRIINQFLKDLTAVDEAVPNVLNYLSQTSLNLLSTLVIVSWLTPMVLPVVGVALVPFYIIAQHYRWAARDLRRLQSLSRSPIMSHFSEAMKGHAVVRAFGAKERFLARSVKLLDENMQGAWYNWAATQWVTVWLELTGTLIVLGSSVLAVWAAQQGKLSASEVGLALTYVVQLPSMLGWFLKEVAQTEVEFVAVERTDEYAHLTTEDAEVNGDLRGKNGGWSAESGEGALKKVGWE